MTPDGDELSGDVVRVGNTVRRDTKPWSSSVQTLLALLHEHGFDRCPLPLGIDQLGRDTVGFIEGDPWQSMGPRVLWSESTLVEVARLLARFHAAQMDFRFHVGAVWCALEKDEAPPEVVCHNDFGLHNIVFRDSSPYAVVDFDLAAPGSMLWDLAFAAISTVPIRDPADLNPMPNDVLDAGRRLRMMCDAYGLGGERRRLIPVISKRLERMASWIKAAQQDGRPVKASLVSELSILDRAQAYLARETSRIKAYL